MTRLLIHVEGQTEETFVNELLDQHLRAHGFSSVNARLVGNARQRHRRGGIRKWEAVRGDILRHLKGDREIVAALMVDYYALPEDWPGRVESRSKQVVAEKAEGIEASLMKDINDAMGQRFDARRFIPLVMMHEFEALLFSAPRKFAEGMSMPELAEELATIRAGFRSPEEINDSAATAPSKRIEGLCPHYEKPLFGVLAALHIGLNAMRSECRHFDDWLSRLETLPAQFQRD